MDKEDESKKRECEECDSWMFWSDHESAWVCCGCDYRETGGESQWRDGNGHAPEREH